MWMQSHESLGVDPSRALGMTGPITDTLHIRELKELYFDLADRENWCIDKSA